MGILNSNSVLTNLQSFASTVVADAVEAVAAGPVAAKTIAEVISVDSDTFTLPVVMPFGSLEQTAGSTPVEQVDVSSITDTIKVYKKAVEIDRFKAADDKLGIYERALRLVGQGAARTYEQIVVDLIKNGGTSTKTITGEALFSTTQTWGKGATAQSNSLSLALTADNLNSAIASFMSFKDSKGELIGRSPTTLVVPPALRSTALKLVNAEYDNYGATNVNNGFLKVVVVPGLAGADTTWYLVDSEFSPFLVLEREGIYTEVDESRLIAEDKYFVNVKARLSGGYGLWCSALKSVG